MTTNPVNSELPPDLAGVVVAKLLIWVTVFLCALVAAVLLFGLGYGEDLAFGWLFFLPRAIPRMTVDVPSVVAGCIAFAGFICCTHLTGRWIASWLPAGQWRRPDWSFWQTCCVVALVVVAFGLGTAMVGAAHQIIWLTSSRTAPSLHLDDDDSILMPVTALRASALTQQGRNTLRQIGIGAVGYEESYNGFPVGRTESATGEPLHGWPILLAAFLSVGPEGVDFGRPWNQPPNDRLFRCQVHDFVNPAMPGRLFDRDGYGLNHFAANVHVFPVHRYQPEETKFYGVRGLSLNDIHDGAGNTIFFGTARGNFKPWGSTDGMRDPMLGINRSPDGFGGAPGSPAAIFLMGDGSTRNVNPNVDPAVLRALATPNGGEPAEHYR